MSRRRPEAFGVSGFLVVDKPRGWTSHDVVDAARRWLGTRRIGRRQGVDERGHQRVANAGRVEPYVRIEAAFAGVIVRVGAAFAPLPRMRVR